jgi:chromosomal replication initiation ATPase DnaA
MSGICQDGWSRIQGRLRASVGEDAYASWFGRLKLEGVRDESAKLSVPTVFLQSWIRKHYAERVLSCLQAEAPGVRRIDIAVRARPLVAFEQRAPKDAPAASEKPIRAPVRVPDKAPVSASVSAPCGAPGSEPAAIGAADEESCACTYPRLPGRISLDDIVRAVTRRYNVSQSDLVSASRAMRIVHLRQVAMYLARIFTGKSFSEIGRRLGGRDHTSVHHGVGKIKWAIGERDDKPPASLHRPCIEIDQKLRQDIESLKRELLELAM